MESDCVAARYDSTGDDVVTIEQRTSDRLADAIDVYRRSSDESDDETGSGCEQTGDHQDAEPTHIEAVIGGGDPLAERLPGITTGA